MELGSLNQQIQSAIELYRQGDAQGAFTHLNNIITQYPDSIEAHFHLACLLQANQQFQDALVRYEYILNIQPSHVDALINMGNVYIMLDQREKTLVCYEKALQIRPQHADLLSNRGHLLTELKRYDEALISLDQALAINPNHISALTNKGVLLCRLEKLEQAVTLFDRVLSIAPNEITVLSNRCQVLITLNRSNEALSDCRRILESQPNNIDILKIMAKALYDLQRFHEAIVVIDRLLIIEPNNQELILAQANLFKAIRQYEQSLKLFNIFLSLQPNHVTALIDRANVFSGLEQLENAINDFDRVIVLEPNNVAAWINKAIVFNKCRLHKLATESYLNVVNILPNDAGIRVAILLHLQHMCDWPAMDEHLKVLKNILSESDYLESFQLSRAMPSTLLSIPTITPKEQLLFARKYTQITTAPTQRTFTKKSPDKKIHVGYFSGDFNHHPVTQLMVEVLEMHNREHFKISAYSARETDNSDLRARVEKSVDAFVDIVHLSDELVAQKIIGDEVDILVDLSGYTEASRSELLSLRPAPIQVSYLGYLGTMGADFIDYIIADDFLVPPGNEIFYAEKIMRLPSYQANDRQCVIGEKPSRATYNLPENAIVFCCFNINYKITSEFFDVWCQLLTNIPNSVLWLFAFSDEAISNLTKETIKRGVDINRLIFARWIPFKEHLARIACADLFLDTAPYNAGTTASNALLAGVPVITYTGETFSSRMAGSLLTALNVPELITYNLKDYYQLAFTLATQPEKRKSLREKIIANKDVGLLFDSVRFTHSLEDVYRRMVSDYQNDKN